MSNAIHQAHFPSQPATHLCTYPASQLSSSSVTELPRSALYHHTIGAACDNAQCIAVFEMAVAMARYTVGWKDQFSMGAPSEPFNIANETRRQRIATTKAMTPSRGRTRQKVGRHLYRLGSTGRPFSEDIVVVVVVVGDIATAMADCSFDTSSVVLFAISRYERVE